MKIAPRDIKKPRIYEGILKPLPAEVSEKDVTAYEKTCKNVKGRAIFTWPKLACNFFPGCCALGILYGFKDGIYPETAMVFPDESTARSFGGKYTTEKVDDVVNMAGYIIHINNKIKSSGKSYVICILNTAQLAAGLGTLLEEWFGFYRIEDDYYNANGSDHIATFGLCLKGYAKGNIEHDGKKLGSNAHSTMIGGNDGYHYQIIEEDGIQIEIA